MSTIPSRVDDLNKNDDRLSLLPILRIAWKWKYILLGVIILSGALAYGVVSRVDKLYESHTILYPSNSNSRDKQLEEFSYGYEIQSERLVQLLNSQHVMDSLIFRFDLANTYDVDMSRKDGFDHLMAKTRQRFQFHKTRFSSVIISVQDENPDRAAKMANEAARLVNVVQSVIMKENAITALEAAEREYRKRSKDISMVNDSIQVIQDVSLNETESRLRQRISQREVRISGLRKSLDQIRQEHQIFDYGFQVNILNEQLADARSLYLQEQGRLEVLEPAAASKDSSILYAKARMMGAKKRMEHFQTKLNDLSAINAKYITSQDHLDEEMELLLQTKLELEQLRGSLEPDIQIRSLDALESDYDWDQVQLRELQRNYQHALANYADPVPIAYVISYAKPSYKAIYPRVFTSIMLAIFGSFSLTLLILTMIERARRGES